MQLTTKLVVSSSVLLTCVGALAIWTAQGQPTQQKPSGQQANSRAPSTVPATAQTPPYPPPLITPAEFDRWMKERSNWGRWGKNDQLGAINLITAAKRKQALAVVKDGISVSLAHRPLTEKALDNPEPFVRETGLSSNRDGTGFTSAHDRYSVYYHGRAHSHLDALCHYFYKGQMYNGFSIKEITPEGGCAKDGVQNLQNGILTRGVLIDIPRLKGVPYLEPGTPVFPEDIEAWEKKAGIKVGAGDAIFLRTGRWAKRAKLGPSEGFAGYHAKVAPWLKDRDVAIVAGDAVQDVGVLPGVGQPIHTFAIAGLGANILDNLDLEAVAETAARLNRWEFLLTLAPIPVEGGTGSPLNPIATF